MKDNSPKLYIFDEDELFAALQAALSDFLKEKFDKKEISSIAGKYRPTKSLPVSNRLGKVMKHVEENYRKKIMVKDVARLVGLSEPAFFTFFKKAMGLSFTSYVNEVRIREASRLLCETNDTVAGIAYTTGFNTPYYFNEMFKQRKGMTPGEYREKG